jgi:hypothetical protein
VSGANAKGTGNLIYQTVFYLYTVTGYVENTCRFEVSLQVEITMLDQDGAVMATTADPFIFPLEPHTKRAFSGQLVFQLSVQDAQKFKHYSLDVRPSLIR